MPKYHKQTISVESLGKIEDLVVSALKNSDKALTLAEIADSVGQPGKKVFKALRKLFEKGLIDSETQRYKLSTK